ncbi:hypothetical protein FAM15346_001838 [Propionibacterium freudenreichii]|uniref:hypothetical protein n=1 Tax=Propionibacterium freudenreichii TaxID=1744 RepID=UPI00254F56B8|nr:hypothetical protein [Propionibacterium freudenreichii]MDK9644772.1 hypothetical protein [Propionibacterium freudenreichii]
MHKKLMPWVRLIEAVETPAGAAPTPAIDPKDPAANPTTEPKPADATSEKPLGEAGKAALDREREARRSADKRASELEARVYQLEDAGKTEAQKQADELKRTQSELETLRGEKARLEVASATGVPVDLLAGPGDDLDAYAQALNAWRDKQSEKPAAPAVDTPSPSPSGVTGQPVQPNRTVDELIAAAEKNGDLATAKQLKLMKLDALRRTS